MSEVKSSVLVVDDDEEMNEMIGQIVEDMGFEALSAHSGGEALSLMRQRPVTAIISDINMPSGTGMELLMRAHVLGSTAPVAFLSGHGTIEYLLEAVRLGAVDFITKPFLPDDLRKLIDRLVAIGQRQERIDELLRHIGGLAPGSRNVIEDLRRQISLLRYLGGSAKGGQG